ncbi:hypothetical protein LCGC14_0488600 [marine sediment metagenome]|uniref:Uncharacterized protein n=1 Tax=marine sediment metagenome TaxID=412755 RepID=A0A0F9VFZ4_9ZZZZ
MTHEQRMASGEGVIQRARRMIDRTKALLKRPTNRNVLEDSVMVKQVLVDLVRKTGILLYGEDIVLTDEFEEQIQGRG